MTRQELFEHYSFYVDEMETNDPISFDLWVSEYLTDLIEVLK
jgi:hypothetical protein